MFLGFHLSEGIAGQARNDGKGEAFDEGSIARSGIAGQARNDGKGAAF